MDLEGKVCLVTGAARRVGRAIARELAHAGGRVVVHHHASGEEAQALVEEIRSEGGFARAERADLRDRVQLHRLVRNVEVEVGYVDVLVNSAADFFETPLETLSDEDWERMLSLNLTAPMRLARRIAPTMLHRKSGVIVNVTDVWGERPLPRYAAYVVSKAGLLALTETLALELAPHVRVNAVAPGTVLPPDGFAPEVVERIERGVPLQRLGSPEDVARAVRFLVEEDYVTGETLHVDGGKHLRGGRA